jgi:gas vesicle protein GvpL/GvpF
MAAAKTQQAGSDQGSARGCYVYGIVPGDVELDSDATGLGDPPAKIELVRNGDVAALVSEIELGHPLGKPEDLMAHEELLDAVAPEVPVLPVQFGAVLTDADAVAEELLGSNHDEFVAALKQLEGRAQYIVKGRYVQDAVLREVLDENPAAGRLREQIQSAGGGDATHNLRIQLGEMINEAVTAKREADTREAGNALASVAVASKVREPTHEEDAANVAVLVDVAKQEELERAVDGLANEWEGRIAVRLLGPMAPYDFVVTDVAGS